MKRELILLVSALMVGCGGVGGDEGSNSGGGGDNPDPSNKKIMTSLKVEVRPEQDKFFYESSYITIKNMPPYGRAAQIVHASVDAREFMVSPVINITYTNMESFPIILFSDTASYPGIDCGATHLPGTCPDFSELNNYDKYPNRCNSYPGKTTRLAPKESCIESIRLHNGVNFTSSEHFYFHNDYNGYLYYNENDRKQSGDGFIDFDVLVGITQDLGKVHNSSGIAPSLKMLPSLDFNYFYRIVPHTNASVGKYEIIYDDVHHTAILNKTPIAMIETPSPGGNTDLVGIANNGDLIGNAQDLPPTYLQNYINKINYAWGTPDIAPGYDDMFVGLDGNNYAVNYGNEYGNFYTGTVLATFTPNEPYMNKLPIKTTIGSYFLVTKEGNVIASNSIDGVLCFIKSKGYEKQSLNLDNIPKWIRPDEKNPRKIYQFSNKVYVFFSDDGGNAEYFAINGADCTVDWDDARHLPVNLDQGDTFGIHTNNKRVLYGIWETGRVLYYPYPPVN